MEPEALPFFPGMLDAFRQMPEVSAIFLLGSAARGELSVCATENGLELFSDIELFVVTERLMPSASRQALAVKMAEIEHSVNNPNPLFHIDLLVREKFRLGQMLPLIFTFELKKNGKCLWGDKTILTKIPEISLQNLDLRDANEILYKRLWAILLHLPKRWLTEDLSLTEKRVAGYIFCRNTLDIPTVLLPQANILLSTYRHRVETLKSIYPDLPFANIFGPEFPAFLELCLARRLDLDFQHVDMNDLYAQTIHYLNLALSCISPGQIGEKEFRKGFNERPISPRQWLNLIKLGQGITRKKGLRTALHWLAMPKKQKLAEGLLAMHQALLCWKNGNAAGAESQLSYSNILLEQLTGYKQTFVSTDFPACWQATRKGWGHFWGTFIRLGDARQGSRYDDIMEWQYA